jgi:hypothetical protein
MSYSAFAHISEFAYPLKMLMGEGKMNNRVRTSIMIGTAFLIGFGLGGLSLHYASAQGMFGLSTSVSQLGSALVDMQKNVDDLQKNMGTIKQVKDQLTSLSPQGGEIPGTDKLKKGSESLKDMIPKF